MNSTADSPDSNTADGVCDDGTGHCTLRAAIQQANATPGTDTINFSIGSGPQTIMPGRQGLPAILDPVVIDGTTQPGFNGAPIIELDGTNAGGAEGLYLVAGNSTIRGLVINRFSGGMSITNNGGNRIEGNYIGTNLAGDARPSNNSNFVSGILIYTPNNIIGGPTPAQRNVISGNGSGVEIRGGYGPNPVVTGTVVQGNYIGTDATGTKALPNTGDSNGVLIFRSSGNLIGGTTPGAGNVVSGNLYNGIAIVDASSTGNIVQGNLVGTAADGVTPLPNQWSGIRVWGSSGNIIGGTAPGAPNTVAYNKLAGISIYGEASLAVGNGNNNAVRANSIHSNEKLGIAFQSSYNTPTQNDDGDLDVGGNNFQNHPLITNVSLNGNSALIQGTLNSAANTNFTLDFFANPTCDPTGYGEGRSYLGSAQVATDGSGNASFNLSFPTTLQGQPIVTATATDPNGNTSEFSPCNTSLSPGFVQFSAASYNFVEDIGQAVITVTRSGGANGAISVNYTTADGTAIAGSDYTATSGTLTFADGETTKTFTVPIINDATAEPDETLNLALSNPTNGAGLGSQSTAVLNLLDSSKLPVLSVGAASLNEGNAGTNSTNVTVSLSAVTGKTVTVNYNTFEVSATSGQDFQPASGTLTFAPGVTTQTISVTAIGDTLDEDNEQFRIGLSNASNAAISVSSNPPMVTIIDDDPLPSLSINDVSVVEGNRGTTQAVFTVTLSTVSGRQVQVGYYTYPNSTIPNGDYQVTTGTLTFAPGQTTQTISVPVIGDLALEGNEIFTVYLHQEVNATIARSPGTGTIIDDDSAPTISINDITIVEDDSGLNGFREAVFTVSLSALTNQQVVFSYTTMDGTAVGLSNAAPLDAADYSGVFGSALFGPNNTTTTIRVPIYGDLRDEFDETFKVVLSNASGATIAKGEGVCTIIDNDPQPSLSVSDASVAEGNAGVSNAVFNVNLSVESGKPVTVNYTTADGTATSGSDYQSVSGQLTFNPGEGSKTITVPLNGDGAIEGNETFFVNISDPLNAIIGDAQGVGTIVNDDPSGSLQFSAANYEAGEGIGSTIITVTRTGNTSGAATVKYSTSDQTDVNFRCNPSTPGQPTGSASRKCDYHIAVGRLRFAPGETSKRIALSLVDDVYVEGPETLTLTLSDPTGAALGQNSTALVSITDNDNGGAANPIDQTGFYVRQLYVDLLSREPEPAGLQGWISRIDLCGQPGQAPPPCDRVTVGGDGFLRSSEFFDRQLFVIRLYRTGLGRIPRYDDVGDLAYVSGFLTDADLELNKQELVAEIMSRTEFSNRYNGLSNSSYLNKLLQTALATSTAIPQSVRDGWLTALNNNSKTRAQVYRELSERTEVNNRYLTEAQVVSCYYGFFTRNPDAAYFDFLDRLNRGVINLGDLANAFINAAEYRQRFGP